MGASNSKVGPKSHGEKEIDDAYAQVNQLTGDRLTKSQIASRLTRTPTSECSFGTYKLRYAALSQRGYYPDALDKDNQDAYVVETKKVGDNNAFFGVFDGHGKYGDIISGFVRDNVIDNFTTSIALQKKNGMSAVLTKAMTGLHDQCHSKHSRGLRDQNSGTTAVCVFVEGKKLHISNIGDSRAVLGTREDGTGFIKAVALSDDQTPYRQDERDRVRKTGARVCNTAQLRGLEPMHDDFNLTLGEETDVGGDPPRVWHKTKKLPGCAFTRSIGDNVAKPLGVCPEPEYMTHTVSAKDAFMLIASDGVWEFLPNSVVVKMVSDFTDPLEACRHVLAEAYRQWMIYDDRTDDITMITAFFDHDMSAAPDEPEAAPPSGLCACFGQKPSAVAPPPAPKPAAAAGTAAVGEQPSSPSARVSALKKLKSMKVKLKAAQRPVRRGMSKEKTKRLQAIAHAAVEIDPNYRVEDHFIEKSASEAALIRQRIRGNFLFEHLSTSQVDTVVKLFEAHNVVEGDRVIRQGDQGDFFYVIEEGEFIVGVNPEARLKHQLVTADMPMGTAIFQYQRDGGGGYCFGELALLHSRPRNASVMATSAGKLWRLSYEAFRALILKPEFNEVLSLLQRVEVLKRLSTYEMQQIADCMTMKLFDKGDLIIEEGAMTDFFYIVKTGNVLVLASTASGTKEEDLELGANDYFNDKALLENCAAEHTVRVESAKCECYAIARSKMEASLGQLSDVIQKHSARRRMWQKVQRVRVDANISGLENFVNLGTLWMRTPHEVADPKKDGTAAVVEDEADDRARTVVSLLRHKDDFASGNSAQLFMLRSMSKHQLLERKKEGFKDAVAGVMREKEIMLRLPAESRFFPQLCKTFADDRCLHSLHFVTPATRLSTLCEEAEGGALVKQEPNARFFAAGMVLALLQLQDLGIACRQVHPESVVLDEDGYPHLFDFHDAKRMGYSDRSFTACGQPEYQAPEQVHKTDGHGIAVDCWSLGVLIYELIAGEGSTPFRTSVAVSEVQMYKNIAHHASGGLKCPAAWSAEVSELINKLLEPDPAERLRFFKDELRTHRWFSGIDFQDMVAGVAKSPAEELCRAKVTRMRAGAGSSGSSTFDTVFANEPNVMDQSSFDGYTLMNAFFGTSGTRVSSFAGAVLQKSEKSVLIRKSSYKKKKARAPAPVVEEGEETLN